MPVGVENSQAASRATASCTFGSAPSAASAGGAPGVWAAASAAVMYGDEHLGVVELHVRLDRLHLRERDVAARERLLAGASLIRALRLPSECPGVM